MTKYTEGPWQLLLDSRGRPAAIKTEDGEHVSFVCGTRYPDGRRDPEAEANAEIMAAAPELVEALRSLVDEREYEKFVGAGERFWSPTNSDGWRKAEKVLAKLKGVTL